MQILKQSTVTTVYVGPVLDSTGAAVTTAVVGDFRLVKNGTAATLSGATVTHDANGYYTIALTAGNTDTVGRLTIAVGNTSMAMATHRYTVVLASVFDALLTNATNATGGLVTATAAITGLSGVIATTTNITSATGIVLAATTHTGATIPTVTTVANRVSANTDQWGGVAVTGMPMPTYTQPAGFLAATFPATVASTTNITTVGAVSGSVGSVTGNVGGNVVGSVGSISGVTFPGNFGVLVINSSGHISRVTLVDTTTTNIDMRGTDGAALATHWTPTRAGYLDGVLVAANYNQRTVSVTGSNHVAADIHELQPAVITAADFAAGAIDANAVAADASSEIATAVRAELAVELARIDVTVGSRLATIGYTAPPTATTIADTTLGRSVSNVEATASEHSICTLVLAALESSVIGTSWTIKRTDGTTTHATKTVTADANASPIVGVQ